MRSFLLYSLLRLAIFAAVWGLLSLTGLHWVYSGILAAVIAMLISVLFLGRIRQALALDVQQRVRSRQERRAAGKSDYERDADDEDAIIDAQGDARGPAGRS